MAEQIDMQGLLQGLIPDSALQDKAEGLRLADMVGQSGSAAAYHQPAQARRLRQGIGGMFGLDMRNEAEKVQDELRELGTPSTAEEHKKYADALDKYKPGSGVQYMMGVAQEERDATRANATATSAGAQATNAQTTADFAERNMTVLENQVTLEQDQLVLAKATQTDLVNHRKAADEQKTRELNIREDENETDALIAANQASALDSRSKAAVREAAKESRDQRRLTTEIRNIANEFARVEVVSGVAGDMIEHWKKLTGTQDEVTALKTKFNQIKNNMVMEALPPGVASDKDIEMAMTGFPADTWPAEQLSEYMKGMAKLSALASAEAEARSIYLSENSGIDAGFEAHWRQVTNEPGFAEELASSRGLIWRPQKDKDGKPIASMSDAEAQRRIAEREAAAAEMARRSREAAVADTAAFVNSINGQSFRGGR